MRALSALGVAALTALAVGAAPATSQAATGSGNPYSPAYGHSYRHGAVPTIAAQARIKAYAAAVGAASTANLTYHGGIDGIGVTTGAEHVYLVFWGSQWGGVGTDGSGNTTLSGDPSGVAPRLQAMYKGLGTNGELWSGVMTQYCEGVASGSQSCPGSASHVAYPGSGVLSGVWVDEGSSAPSQATGSQLGQEAINAAGHFGNTSSGSNRDAQYVVVSPTGTHPDGFNTSSGSFCAWHSYTSSSYGDIAFHNMPYVPDAGGSCGQNAVNGGGAGNLDGVTIVDGHEYAETITDQNPNGGWLDSSGAENADKCAWVSPGQPGGMGNLSLATGTFAMQGTWGNDANGGGGGCEFSHSIVTNGGGGGSGSGSATGPITSGVSSGLCIDDRSSSTTNFNPVQIWTCNGTGAQQWSVVYASNTLQVLGKCMDVNGGGTANGTQVDLYDCNGTGAQVFVPQANGSLLNPQSGRCLDDPNSSTTTGTQLQLWDCNGGGAQHWNLPQATGQITGIAGLCVDDRSSSTTNFNPIQIWGCNGSGAQQWTVVENGNTLRVLGKCMDVNGGGTGNGTQIDLYDCNGTGAQVFVQQANGSLLNPQSGRCLDDPNSSTTTGTQLQLWDCNGTAAQQWNLP